MACRYAERMTVVFVMVNAMRAELLLRRHISRLFQSATGLLPYFRKPDESRPNAVYSMKTDGALAMKGAGRGLFFINGVHFLLSGRPLLPSVRVHG
ncbi:MAG: hypothetical protein ACLUIQ_09155 [Dialister invisus]